VSEPGWIEIAVEVAGIDAELAADLLRQACTGGVAIEAPSRLDPHADAYVLDGDASALVKGYLPASEDAERAQGGMKLALQAAPLQRPPVWRPPRPLQDEDWRDSWKKYFGVMKIGDALVIAPSWIEYEARPGETVVRIDPGMAFGTGQHPTTAMCLAALERFAPQAADVLDLGCGSGILAIAAAGLGAQRVLAIDIDPQAVKAARANAAENGVADRLEVREGTLDAAEGETFDIVVANISAITLERIAPAMITSVRPDGHIILAGFLTDATEAVLAPFLTRGYEVDSLPVEGVWQAIIAHRGSGS
jgi:ribosomal protein L11 methyltransferase